MTESTGLKDEEKEAEELYAKLAAKILSTAADDIKFLSQPDLAQVDETKLETILQSHNKPSEYE